MEHALVRTQQSLEQPGDPAMRDNLFEPKKDGLVEGTQRFPVKRFSLFLEAQKHPLAAAGVLAGGVITAALLARRKATLG